VRIAYSRQRIIPIYFIGQDGLGNDSRDRAAFALGIALISLESLALGASPAGVFNALWQGAFGNWIAFTDSIVKFTPLVFTGLSISVAFSAALWNIGPMDNW
jgi:ABC-type uncharacterized transport system permease subunit